MPLILPLADSRKIGRSLPAFSISAGSSPYTYQNTTNYLQEVVVSGGTVTSINMVRNGVSQATSLLSGVFMLAPNDELIIAYTTVPDIMVFPI